MLEVGACRCRRGDDYDDDDDGDDVGSNEVGNDWEERRGDERERGSNER